MSGWGSRRRARSLSAALGVAAAIAAWGSAAAAAPADPCAEVPQATADPATEENYASPSRDRLWVVPPGGSCAVEGSGNARRIALRHADGGLWATWTIEPLDGGVTAFFSGGRSVQIVEESYPAPPPEPARLRTASGDGTVIAPSVRSARPGPGCRAARRIRVSPREGLAMRLDSPPLRVLLRERPGVRGRGLAPRELVRWRVAATLRVGRWHTLDLDVIDENGRVSHYAVCVTRASE